MTDHPILFKGDMVRAILDGRKTQTRRIIKPQPTRYICDVADRPMWDWRKGKGRCAWAIDMKPRMGAKQFFIEHCPYGVPGDLLYVRENWWAVEVDRAGIQYCVFDDEFEIEPLGGQYPAPDILRLLDRQNWRYGRHPNIHLPKKQCRLWLKVKSVRVERVQDISEDDAILEGTKGGGIHPDFWAGAFHDLWDSINKKRGFGWDVNPWVWVIEFERYNK